MHLYIGPHKVQAIIYCQLRQRRNQHHVADRQWCSPHTESHMHRAKAVPSLDGGRSVRVGRGAWTRGGGLRPLVNPEVLW